MKYFYIISILSITTYLGLFTNNNSTKCPNIPNIVNFKIEEYLGNWYEILHSKDFIWDYGCECIQANYTVDNHNKLIVNNSCNRFGKEVNAIGSGIYKGGGKFSITFGLFSAPYEIAYIDEDYDISIVVSCINLPLFKPNVWLLSRQPKIGDMSKLNLYLEKIRNLGFSNKEISINKSC